MSIQQSVPTQHERMWVVVAAKQIQPWIARTPSLKLMRGASRALKDLTSRADLTNHLGGELANLGATVEVEGTTVDGVVTLTVRDHDQAPVVAERVVAYLADRLPGLTWEAWWTAAPDYVIAEDRHRTSESAHVARVPHELPFARACGTCRQEAAFTQRTPTTPKPGSPDAGTPASEWMGRDCVTRLENAAHDQRWTSVDGTWPEDFDTLANGGGRPSLIAPDRQPGTVDQANQPPPRTGSQVVGRHRSANHVATICADGNRMGDLFEIVAQAGPGFAAFRLSLSETLNTTLQDQVEDAARGLSVDASTKVGIPHYIGGDDVLVSVRAEAAWPFVAALMTVFDTIKTALHAELADLTLPAGTDQPNHDAHRAQIAAAIDGISLGVGLVFSHASHPFDACRHHGEAALAVAKDKTRGAQSAVCWVDLTEGSHPSHNRVRTAEQLAALLAAPPEGVATLPRTARNQLHTLILQTPPSTASSGTAPAWKPAAAAWIRRNQPKTFTAAYLDELDRKGTLDHVPTELSRLRWWPDGTPAPAAAAPGHERPEVDEGAGS